MCEAENSTGSAKETVIRKFVSDGWMAEEANWHF